MRAGTIVYVPAGMVDLDGVPAIAWWEIDRNTGEVVGASENGGHQNMVEFAIIVALVAVAGLVSPSP